MVLELVILDSVHGHLIQRRGNATDEERIKPSEIDRKPSNSLQHIKCVQYFLKLMSVDQASSMGLREKTGDNCNVTAEFEGGGGRGGGRG